MKRILPVVLFVTFLTSSCAIHNGLTSNANLHTTEVVLSENNYTVIDRVQGSSEAMYVFGIGGLNKSAMLAEAKNQMLAKAGLPGTSRAIMDETVEITHSLFPFFRTYRVTVSAFVVEFH